MLTNQENQLSDMSFFNRLFAPVLGSSLEPKTHNFTNQVESDNYEIEAIDSRRIQMTGYGKKIKPGDFIILSKEKIRYRVEDIDYYANPGNLWTAILLKV